MAIHRGIVDSRNRCWNSTTLAWEPEERSAGGAGSTQVSVKELLTSSGGSLVDSSKVSLRVSVVEQPAGGSTQVSVSGYTFDSSGALQVNSGPSGAGSTVQTISTGSVRVHQSTAADLNVTVAGYSTVVAVSTGSVRVHQSTAADLNVTVAGYSTIMAVSSMGGVVKAALCDSTGLGIESSTRSNAASTMRGLAVRSIIPDCTGASGQAAAAGDNAILSSNAQAIYVYAFTWSQISSAAQLIRWLRGSTSECWRTRIVAPSTIGIPAYDMSLAVSPPAYLFRTSTGQNLVLNVTSSGVSYSVAAWREG